MSTFTTQINLESINDGKSWKLIESFEYHIGEYPSKNIITVPAGFITDLMTVPRFILPFFNPLLHQYSKPSIIHDWLYDKDSKDKYNINTRLQADKVFLEAMAVLGVSRVKRYLIYQAVRLFAKKFYNTTSNGSLK